MESPCYRCGAPVEEQTPFCPSCKAPQIRVSAPAIAQADQPSTAPLPPGTPSSIEPPAVPVHFDHAAHLDWKRFLRTATPLSLLAGIGLAYMGLFGVIIFFAMVAISVIRYRSYHPFSLSSTQGARLGAVAGLLGFIVVLLLVVAGVIANPDEARRQFTTQAQQWVASHPDPHARQWAQWATTTQGMLVLGAIGTFITLVLCVIVSSAIGAIAASLSSNKNRR